MLRYIVPNKFVTRAGYTYSSTGGLSISQETPCTLPSEVLLAWQSC